MANEIRLTFNGTDDVLDVSEVLEIIQDGGLEVELFQKRGNFGNYKVMLWYPLQKKIIIGWVLQEEDWRQEEFEQENATAATEKYNEIIF